MSIESLLGQMWSDYCQLNPSAKKIFDLLTESGEQVLNDHIALRTFNHKRVGLSALAIHFEKYGYKEGGEYHFKEKKLYAKHWQHKDLNLPKIFISELKLEECSSLIQKTAEEIIAQIPDSLIKDEKFTMCGRPWKMSHKLYSELAKESEYASWLSAIGYRPNHFTVSINALKKYNDIDKLNNFISSNGYEMNASGGLVKGTLEDHLVQSSTMAKEVSIQFDEGKFNIPGCYYEFAKRYPMQNGELYQGFVAKSADKIFESTNRQK